MRNLTRATGRGTSSTDYLSHYGTGSQSYRSRTELAFPLDTPLLRYTECLQEETLAVKSSGKEKCKTCQFCSPKNLKRSFARYLDSFLTLKGPRKNI